MNLEHCSHAHKHLELIKPYQLLSIDPVFKAKIDIDIFFNQFKFVRRYRNIHWSYVSANPVSPSVCSNCICYCFADVFTLICCFWPKNKSFDQRAKCRLGPWKRFVISVEPSSFECGWATDKILVEQFVSLRHLLWVCLISRPICLCVCVCMFV